MTLDRNLLSNNIVRAMSHHEGRNLKKTIILSKPVTKNNPILTITGLDNDDDSGSISLGSERLYEKYGDRFVVSKETREFITGIIRRRRKYDPNSKMKLDAIEGVCAI